MAASPRFKVYLENDYRGSLHYLEDAAALVACIGDGATVRDGHRKAATVWTEGAEDFPASESYDGAAEVMRGRVKAFTLR